MKHRVVVVVWDDAHAISDAWGKFEPKDHKPRRIHSVGYLVRQDKIGISMVQSFDTEKNDDHGLFVPACNIVSVTNLEAT